MTILKKLKQIMFDTTKAPQKNTNITSNQDTDEITELKTQLLNHLPQELPEYLRPITSTITQWLSGQNWHFQSHDPHPDDSFRTHHLTLTFGEKDYDWNCVFRINEKNQLVTIYGVLLLSVPKSHYLNALWHISQANHHTSFGGIELDLNSGDIRAKISFDAEFTHINERTLSIYMQGLSGLVELAFDVYQHATNESPIQNFEELLHTTNNDSDSDDGDFFIATPIKQ